VVNVAYSSIGRASTATHQDVLVQALPGDRDEVASDQRRRRAAEERLLIVIWEEETSDGSDSQVPAFLLVG